MPIRGILLAFATDPFLIIAIQLFDGLGAAVFGVLFPLIVADVTRDTGHYTTSLGLVGLAVGGGATLSTALAGLVADDLGVGAAFLSLAGRPSAAPPSFLQIRLVPRCSEEWSYALTR